MKKRFETSVLFISDYCTKTIGRSFIKPLIFALILSLASGCHKDTSKADSKQTLLLNLPEDPSSLDPRIVRSLRDLTVVKQLFEGLTRLDQQGIPQPALAKEIEISEDQLTYTFALRATTWTNGEAVVAQDFVQAWQQVLDPKFACDYAYMLYPIKNARLAKEGKCRFEEVGITIVDEQTLVIELEAPTPYFLELTAFPTFFPVNHKLDTSNARWSLPPGQMFVSNGPFRLKKWAPQVELDLEKNPDYWDLPAINIDAIHFTIISDGLTESLLFEKGELDWLGQPISFTMAPEVLSKMRQMGCLASYPVAGTYWLKFNVEKAPFSNIKLRKAFAYAINREEIITHLLQGNQKPATGPLPPTMVHQLALYFCDGDIEKARALFEEGLAEEGWSRDTFPTVVLNCPASARHSKIVQLIQRQWEDAFGIIANLEALENQVYLSNSKRGLFQVGTGEWIADFNDPIAFLELFKQKRDPVTGSGMNDTGWHHSEYSTLLEDAMKEVDHERREQMLLKAESILMQEMPVAPIYHYAFDYAKKKSIQDVLLSPLGIADFKYAKKIACEGVASE